MTDQHLHIVCLDVPYPADYGGVFDLFYKIVALHEQDIKIHLHCFEYGRGKQNELNKYCAEVSYYKRSKGLRGLSFHLPYIVNSRRDKKLLENLLKDDYPILLEGIHCTYLLHQNKLINRKVFVRLHNVEFEYYKQLSRSETSFFKKLYFSFESRLLKKYEREISNKATFISVSEKDKEAYQKLFETKSIFYLPVFLPYNFVSSKEGKGNYCLYHGNLSVAENEKAALWLLNIFKTLASPLIIAGKNPSAELRELINSPGFEIHELIANPPEEKMIQLICEAHINILPSFNSTGIKIKLLNALFNGRFCLVNPQAAAGSGLEDLCNIATDLNTFEDMILNLEEKTFMQEDIQKRKTALLSKFNNEENAKQLMTWIC